MSRLEELKDGSQFISDVQSVQKSIKSERRLLNQLVTQQNMIRQRDPNHSQGQGKSKGFFSFLACCVCTKASGTGKKGDYGDPTKSVYTPSSKLRGNNKI